MYFLGGISALHIKFWKTKNLNRRGAVRFWKKKLFCPILPPICESGSSHTSADPNLDFIIIDNDTKIIFEKGIDQNQWKF